MNADERHDIVVVGCGAAGLSAAVSYAESAGSSREARIAVLEKAPEAERGGSSRWTEAGMRVDQEFVLDPLWIDEMYEVSKGLVDRDLLTAFERAVPETGRFLRDHDVEFIDCTGAIGTSGAWMMPGGGGRAIVDALARHLGEHSGATIHYETEAVSLAVADDGRVNGVRVRSSDGAMRTLYADAVVLACGGFQGSYEMLTRYLGRDAVNLRRIVPGTRFNTGDGIRMALELGAATAGQFDRAHTECVDTRTDRPDAIVMWHNYAIVVNSEGRRFLDEGEKNVFNSFEPVAFDIWEKAGNTAFYITDETAAGDSRLSPLFSTAIPAAQADTIAELATMLGLDPATLELTVAEFNAACADAPWDPATYDGKATIGLDPPKSNWASPIVRPPYYGAPVTAAIVFSYGGLQTDADARVLSTGGFTIPGLYAVGELTGITYHAYPPLTQVLRACTFGRIAGAHAAAHARALVETH